MKKTLGFSTFRKYCHAKEIKVSIEGYSESCVKRPNAREDGGSGLCKETYCPLWKRFKNQPPEAA